jgi:hypothetical protein
LTPYDAGLIITRIWRVTRSVSGIRVTESRVQQFGRVILESGLIYTVSSLIVVVVAVTRSNALYIAADGVSYYIYLLYTTTNVQTSLFPLPLSAST